MTTPAELEAEFASRGIGRGGLLLMPQPVALAFIQRAREAGLAVLGIDGFHVSPKSIRPDLDQSLDLSAASRYTDSWSHASAFLVARGAVPMYYEVVLAERPAK